MKLRYITRLVGLVALSIGGLAHASGPDYIFADGGAVLSFTSDSLSALNTAGVTVTAALPATFDGSKITMTSDDQNVVWNSNYDITSMTGFGGFTLTSSTTKGAQVVLTNITLDPTISTVFADVVTSSFSNAFGSYKAKSIAHMALFTGSLAGNSNIEASSGNVSLSVQDLKLASVAIPELGNALGVPSFIQQALFPSINFGKISLNGTFVAAPVPEPSTYMLLGAGLLALTQVKRRRAAP